MKITELRNLVETMPFNTLLGITVAKLHKDGVTLECKVKKELLNSAEVLHGGVFATVADAAVGISLARHFGERRPITTVELKINYLRPVSQGKIKARARLLRVGARVCVGSVEIKDAENRMVAAALLSYIQL